MAGRILEGLLQEQASHLESAQDAECFAADMIDRTSKSAGQSVEKMVLHITGEACYRLKQMYEHKR